MKRFISLFLLLSAPAALAESVKFSNRLYSGYIPDVGTISLYPAKDGKILVDHDRNTCDSNGVCTKMVFHPEEVEAKVIHDHRSADGHLLLALTPEIKLSVSSGFNNSFGPTYTAIVKLRSGEVSVPLHPYLTLNIE